MVRNKDALYQYLNLDQMTTGYVESLVRGDKSSETVSDLWCVFELIALVLQPEVLIFRWSFSSPFLQMKVFSVKICKK